MTIDRLFDILGTDKSKIEDKEFLQKEVCGEDIAQMLKYSMDTLWALKEEREQYKNLKPIEEIVDEVTNG